MSGAAVINAFKGIVLGCTGAAAASLVLKLAGQKVPIATDMTTHLWKH